MIITLEVFDVEREYKPLPLMATLTPEDIAILTAQFADARSEWPYEPKPDHIHTWYRSGDTDYLVEATFHDNLGAAIAATLPPKGSPA